MSAAKKHHTDVRYWVKNIAVTRHERNIRMPRRWVFFILEIKRGAIVTIR
jgi:hypothetical protein